MKAKTKHQSKKATGDFRQTLPVIPRGTRADQINACLKRSYIWSFVEKLSLKTNMRALRNGDEDMVEFTKLLLDIGDGKLNGFIKLTNAHICNTVLSLECLIQSVYPDISNVASLPGIWLEERVILAPNNESVHRINNMILDQLETQSFCYKSVDLTVNKEDSIHYPVEFLNSLNPSGIPRHDLLLKIGTPIMLLRNLNPPKLCNGTRLKVKSLKQHTIEAVILTGCGKGETVFIPRIPMIPTDLPFNFKRLQFPITPCFAMTINKAQGQTLKIIGIDITEQCFSHGQLYVALSRVSSSSNLFVLARNAEALNVVYEEALTN